MFNSYSQIGEKKFMEESGLLYEDFVVGHIFEHRPGRTITATDNTWCSLIAMNQHPIHIDQSYASKTEFNKILVSSLITFCIINGMTVKTISAKAVANLGWDKVKLVNPVFIGDTLYATTKILGKRISQKNPKRGVVKVKTIGYNQDKKIVISFERNILIPKRGCDVCYSNNALDEPNFFE
jgi:acyl dehydratase